MSAGKRWAYAAAGVGGVVSVLANIAHSFVPPAGMPADWRPNGGAVALAAFWPLALLLAIEVIARVEWPDHRRWALVRWGGVTPVALVAAVVSYRHLSGLLRWYGEDAVTVSIGPLAVDGLMVVSTGALLALAARMAPAVVVETDAQPETDGSAETDGQSDGSDGPVETDGSGAEETVGSAQSDGSGRVAALALVPDRVVAAVPAAPSAELAHARRLIEAGRLTAPFTADRIMKAIKDDGGKLGLPKARAIRDALSTEPEEDQQEA